MKLPADCCKNVERGDKQDISEFAGYQSSGRQTFGASRSYQAIALAEFVLKVESKI